MMRTLWLGAAMVSALVWAGAAWAADAPGPSSAAASSNASLSTAASGNVVISGNPQAEACQEAAKFGDFNGVGIDECSLALGRALMSNHDLAATYVDRGAIYMQHHQYGPAKADFDSALKLDPTIANAYVDRGGALIAMKRYADSIADIDRGLALGPEQPEKAYYNRAIDDENLGDLKTAYADYQKASQLKPDWAAPKTELARFTARAQSSTGP
jgi:tetratricopeptide (TPR) repeat protein